VQFGGGKIGPWGEYEQHISGDICLAARQYYYATQDKAWLKEIGYPLAKGVANFYSRRVAPKPGNANSAEGSYDYNGVMGPDEFAYPVNNSAYTNAAAGIALAFATEAAAALGEKADPLWATVAAGLQLEVDQKVPTRPDLKGGYHPEYKGFPKDPSKPSVKQADTIMLSYPLGVAIPAQVLANDLSFYDPITDPNGPAMTWAIFAVGWINAGNFSMAAPHFQRGYANVHPPFNVWTESPTGGTVNFITGAGGFSAVRDLRHLGNAAGERRPDVPAAAAARHGLQGHHDGRPLLPLPRPPAVAAGARADDVVRSAVFRARRARPNLHAGRRRGPTACGGASGQGRQARQVQDLRQVDLRVD